MGTLRLIALLATVGLVPACNASNDMERGIRPQNESVFKNPNDTVFMNQEDISEGKSEDASTRFGSPSDSHDEDMWGKGSSQEKTPSQNQPPSKIPSDPVDGESITVSTTNLCNSAQASGYTSVKSAASGVTAVVRTNKNREILQIDHQPDGSSIQEAIKDRKFTFSGASGWNQLADGEDGAMLITLCDQAMVASCKQEISKFMQGYHYGKGATSEIDFKNGVLGMFHYKAGRKGVGVGGDAHGEEGTPMLVLYDKVPAAGRPNECDIKASPLAINIAGDAIELSPQKDGVLFDIFGNGEKHQISWSTQDTLGFLALDKDDDGDIASVHELFGNNTVGPDEKSSRNGFEALAKYDSNLDGVIDHKDVVFSKLRLWFDLNRDGVSDHSELKSLEEVGIKSISLDYVLKVETDLYGNETRERSIVEIETSRGVEQRLMFDIWFKL